MKTRMRIAVAIAAVAGLAGAGGGVALASSGPPAASTHATTSVHVRAATSGQLTWHPLHLINGWKTMSAKYYGAPSYAIQDGVLYLSGILAAPRSVTGPEFAVLPASARPKHFLWLLYYNFGGSGTGMVGNMEIQPDGDMFIYGPPSGPILYPTLQAISFPVSS
jgi:hypothetical protein